VKFGSLKSGSVIERLSAQYASDVASTCLS